MDSDNDKDKEQTTTKASAAAETNARTRSAVGAATVIVFHERTKEDVELETLRKMRTAFAATLFMLENARDGLVQLGDRMDRLRVASEQCRRHLRRKARKDRTTREDNDDEIEVEVEQGRKTKDYDGDADADFELDSDGDNNDDVSMTAI